MSDRLAATLPRASVDYASAVEGSLDIEASNIDHYFTAPGKARAVHAVDNVTLKIPSGQFVAIVGPSGCGKTTLLNMVAGLVEPSSGSLLVGGTHVRGSRKEFGYVFARDTLLPWRTVRENVEFILWMAGFGKKERREAAADWLRRVGLADFADAYRYQLSQGMRQRVALARTLATRPRLILMDEPFAALDAQTRLILQNEFINLWQETGATVVFVTHDLTEAILLADRVILMTRRPGQIKVDIEVTLPRPRDLDAARFSPAFKDAYAMLSKSLREELDFL